MARLPRLTIPGYPHQVIQSGNNKEPIFQDAADYERMLGLLAEHAEREKVAIHSYVLMPSHFHLLATPETTAGLSRMMQGIGRTYVRYFNSRYARSGALWEGRYRAAPIQPDRYLLTCMAFTDLSPVRAGLAAGPADYRWSTHGHYAGLRSDKLVRPHALYWQLGNTPFSREAAYAEVVGKGVSSAVVAALTDSASKGWVLGESEFVATVQTQTSRRLLRQIAGRPSVSNGYKNKK